ncbi:N-formylglutamate deformylase [Dyella sp. M7H15-1]|uniref:N-formylglutamate deformylase n=1 Tax=Dyella sp. M7H15-1 TaxID=2501295 RepID=UPI001004E395|nr:N-formylglutamate deformylase [Dyella sp. M7H15-1]QAU24013.1 N-formylglutamate deformylase [Dyella sp. M7H15-1]
MDTFTLKQGSAPLLISLPHNGSYIPDELAARLHSAARRSPDTDWHVAQLYEPLAEELGASVLKPVASRYVIDLNRPAGGQALYPGRRETGLVPTIGFDGEPLYLDGQEPGAEEIQQRIDCWWRPYHQALVEEMARLKAQHGQVVLWEGHSIRSHVPMLFEGRLPDFNLGTADGVSCGSDLQRNLTHVMEAQRRYDFVVNGRFKGGYITRHYGKPEEGMQAVQLELSQCRYMDEDSFAWDATKAALVQDILRKLLRQCLS